MTDLTLLVNPAARGGVAARRHEEVELALRSRGWNVHTHLTTGPEDASARAAEQPAGALVAALGGDGFVALAAHGVMAADAVLAPLPGGRGNDFCRALGVPADPVAAALALPQARERVIDVGAVDGHPFLGVASVGYDSVANTYANRARWLRGPAVYAWGGTRAVLGFTPMRFRLTLDGVVHDHVGWNVAVGQSGRYGGGMRVCPDAVLDDGLLDVLTVGPLPRRAFVRVLPRFYAGTHVGLDGFTQHRAARVRIEADDDLVVYADGDPIGRLPCDIEVRPAALRVRG